MLRIYQYMYYVLSTQVSYAKYIYKLQMLSEHSSLVKYSTPVLMSSGVRAKKGAGEQTDDFLGRILPAKQTQTQSGQTWVQTVLSTPATKIEVIQLHEELQRRLMVRGARELGLCPVRQELFDQCFDEIIRQIAIDCRQRGLLLVRIRDEYRCQIKAYKHLYESSICHSMRRVIDSDAKKTTMVGSALRSIYKLHSSRRNAVSWRRSLLIWAQTSPLRRRTRARLQGIRLKHIGAESMRQWRRIGSLRRRYKMYQRRINDVCIIKMSYPRQKLYLKNLNELLSSKVVVQAEAEITKKLFPSRNFSHRLSLTHKRIQSSIQIRTLRYESRPQKQQRIEKVRNKSKINFLVEKKQQQSNGGLMRSHSLSVPLECNLHHSTHSHHFTPQSTHRDTNRAFLKKGSSLQKQIVVNLMRNKLMRENPQQYQNSDILKLIKVYRGETKEKKKRAGISQQINKLQMKASPIIFDKYLKPWQINDNQIEKQKDMY